MRYQQPYQINQCERCIVRSGGWNDTLCSTQYASGFVVFAAFVHRSETGIDIIQGSFTGTGTMVLLLRHYSVNTKIFGYKWLVKYHRHLHVNFIFIHPYIYVAVMTHPCPGGRFKNTYELLNLRALKISMLYKNRIFRCIGKIFCVEFQRYPLKFHSKYLTHTLKDVHFIHRWKFKSS